MTMTTIVPIIGDDLFSNEAVIQPPDPSLHVLSKPGGGKRLPRLLLIKPVCTCKTPPNGLCCNVKFDGFVKSLLAAFPFMV